MREILFRGKRIDNCEWIYGMPCATEQSGIYAIQTLYGGIFDIIPDTVGQYTDLTDKDGKKIFEGDIVCLDEDVKMTFNVYDGEVKYGRGGFYIGDFGLLNSLNAIASYDWVLRGEVIGNIHDNPEFSKGG